MFLDKLSEEEIVELVNLCNMEENRILGFDLNEEIDFALVSNEEGRRLVSGERYYFLRGIKRGAIPKFIGDYKATDFWMASCLPLHKENDYSHILREFLARKFGTEYLDALYEHHIAEAQEERKDLETKIGITR